MCQDQLAGSVTHGRHVWERVGKVLGRRVLGPARAQWLAHEARGIFEVLEKEVVCAQTRQDFLVQE